MRTRFAPSPTGLLHVGGARTAILNWLVARHHGGSFVLRIEDTDLERNLPGAEAELLDDLRWLGLDWNEGPDLGGPFGPYRQSERLDLYREHAARLLAAGHAYHCTCPPAPLEASGERRQRCPCADRPRAFALSGKRERGPGGEGLAGPEEGGAIRFRVPDLEEVGVEDLVRGRVTFPAESIEDFVLLRSDGRPTYNFAAAVDDAAMRITHVIRGADHLINTPKQLLLYRAFGWEVPHFAHIPLILGPDRQKLSKRHGATSVAEHWRAGYLPEALMNYLSLLSWSSPSGEEFLPPERLVAEVDLERVGASDAVFDREKLRWLSSQYLQALPLEELMWRLERFIDRDRFPLPEEALPAAIIALRSRLSLLGEVNDHLAPFAGHLTPQQQQARAQILRDSAARPVLAAARAAGGAARLGGRGDQAGDLRCRPGCGRARQGAIPPAAAGTDGGGARAGSGQRDVRAWPRAGARTARGGARRGRGASLTRPASRPIFICFLAPEPRQPCAP